VAQQDRPPLDLSIDDDLDDDEWTPSRWHNILWAVTIAACALVAVGAVVLLVVQPGKSSGNPKQCWDSAMQMEMPCASSTP
jgi:hypothetical protein